MFFQRPVSESRYLDPNPLRRKFCGCMSLRAGCAVACAIWIGINIFIAAESFQGYTPIFSFLNKPALITYGSLSIAFALVALLVLYGLFVDTPLALQAGVVFLVFIIPIYLLDMLANVFIFGIQKPSYLDWCSTSSISQMLDERISGASTNGTVSTLDSIIPPIPIYHCQKLWEDEIKFSLAVWIIMCICYIYWGMCVFYYYEKLRELFPIQSSYPSGGFMNYLYAPGRFLTPYSFRNTAPSSKV
ncbi:uncharacterized protein B0P05DRAFT_637624 [Gilbertella persicaria]|uniref:uncharacterized protein n=1 Tax=Gilbertella persicaria TaxID=101096 RepID=UPI002220152E|nr:uncharacterized protein B0P05DRAFT_637624 [Gilbertella persicaria]KAI8078105.1 hypothetical protein B0P05DRAFT_637624 [Gilbertella persicaria]